MEAAKAILICGKLCCGKSTYTEKLRRERKAAVLSCDDLTLALFDERLGNDHERVTQKAQAYLFRQAASFLETGIPVILEWGFWTKESREQAERFFRERGFETEWHYLEISDETWRKNIAKRNGSDSGSYFVDEGLAEKCASLFEPPLSEEIDVWVNNDWT